MTDEAVARAYHLLAHGRQPWICRECQNDADRFAEAIGIAGYRIIGPEDEERLFAMIASALKRADDADELYGSFHTFPETEARVAVRALLRGDETP